MRGLGAALAILAVFGFPGAATASHASEEGEYIWADRAGDERTDFASPDPRVDIAGVRYTGTATVPNVLVYYVDPGSVGGTCSDSHTLVQAQSTSTPWCSVDRAADQAAAGLVQIRGGNYEAFRIIGECRASWVTFEPYPGETVRIDGGAGGTLDFNGAWKIENSCYIRVVGFELTDRFFLDLNNDHIDLVGNWIHSKHTNPTASSGSANVTTSGVAMRCQGGGCTANQTYIRILHNRIEDVAYQCLGVGSDLNGCDTLDNSVGVGYGYCIAAGLNGVGYEIRGNQIDGCWEDAIQGASDGAIIADNVIQNVCCGGSGHQDGIQIFGSVGDENVQILRNRFIEKQATCMRIQDRPRTNFTIENNVCAGTIGGRCMDLEELRDSTVRFNTCGSSRYGFVLEDDSGVTGKPDRVMLENNIFHPAWGGSSIGIAGTNITYRYNIVPDAPGTGSAVLSNCTPGCIGSEATFINEAAGDVRLATGSVGIDAGNAVPGIVLDVLGHPRMFDIPSVVDTGGGLPSFTDIGAYELFVAAPPLQPQPQPQPQPQSQSQSQPQPLPPATARQPARRCLVPNVKGKTLRAARRAIKRAGCRAVVMGRRYSAAASRGRVLRQSVRPRARVRRGTIVRLLLSRGAKPVRRLSTG